MTRLLAVATAVVALAMVASPGECTLYVFFCVVSVLSAACTPCRAVLTQQSTASPNPVRLLACSNHDNTRTCVAKKTNRIQPTFSN